MEWLYKICSQRNKVIKYSRTVVNTTVIPSDESDDSDVEIIEQKTQIVLIEDDDDDVDDDSYEKTEMANKESLNSNQNKNSLMNSSSDSLLSKNVTEENTKEMDTNATATSENTATSSENQQNSLFFIDTRINSNYPLEPPIYEASTIDILSHKQNSSSIVKSSKKITTESILSSLIYLPQEQSSSASEPFIDITSPSQSSKNVSNEKAEESPNKITISTEEVSPDKIETITNELPSTVTVEPIQKESTKLPSTIVLENQPPVKRRKKSVNDDVIFVSETILSPKKLSAIDFLGDFISLGTNNNKNYNNNSHKKHRLTKKERISIRQELQKRRREMRLNEEKRSNKTVPGITTRSKLTNIIGNPETSTAAKPQIEPSVYDTANKQDPKDLGHKRMIIVDGSNVAFAHSNCKNFSVNGLKICIDFFTKTGHEVKAVVPRMRLKKHMSTDSEELERLYREGKIVLTPCKNLPGKNATSYDDRFVLQLAESFDAAILSNDNYRDLLHENPAWRDIVETRVIGFTWCNDMFLLPKDPYGRKGPNLDEILIRKQPAATAAQLV